MQNLINVAPVKKNYVFIDNIRCIAMIGIVADHNFNVGDYIFQVYSTNYWIYFINIQLAKFGTISFFLLAGFLLGDKFTEYTPGQYLNRRFKNTFKPWIIWSLIFLAVIIIKEAVVTAKFNPGHFNFVETLVNGLAIVYLYSNYWFIINFLICIAILLIFRKNLYSLKLGSILLACTLFYCVNCYYEWIFPIHTTAIFGFVFFLWLGAQLNKKWNIIDEKIKELPYYVFILAFLLTFAFTAFESTRLMALKSMEPVNTLRFSNILYSLAACALLIKIRDFNWISYFKPRETTYGIYLVHYILVYALVDEILRHFNIGKPANLSVWGIVAYQYVRFIIVYLITFGFVMAVNSTPYRWLIGNNMPVNKNK